MYMLLWQPWDTLLGMLSEFVRSKHQWGLLQVSRIFKVLLTFPNPLSGFVSAKSNHFEDTGGAFSSPMKGSWARSRSRSWAPKRSGSRAFQKPRDRPRPSYAGISSWCRRCSWQSLSWPHFKSWLTLCAPVSWCCRLGHDACCPHLTCSHHQTWIP